MYLDAWVPVHMYISYIYIYTHTYIPTYIYIYIYIHTYTLSKPQQKASDFVRLRKPTCNPEATVLATGGRGGAVDFRDLLPRQSNKPNGGDV